MQAGRGSKVKGAKFERAVCRQLSLWLTRGRRSDCFWRSAMSGGRATLMRRRGVVNRAQAGDISAVDPAGEWLIANVVVECKHLRDLCLLPAIVLGSGPFVQIWEKVSEQARDSRRTPLVIAKQNRMPTLLITTPIGTNILRASEARIAHIHRLGADIFLFDDVLALPVPVGQRTAMIERRPRLRRIPHG